MPVTHCLLHIHSVTDRKRQLPAFCITEFQTNLSLASVSMMELMLLQHLHSKQIWEGEKHNRDHEAQIIILLH